jgi:hypothetical protein
MRDAPEVIRVTFGGAKLLAWGEPGDGISIAPPDVQSQAR